MLHANVTPAIVNFHFHLARNSTQTKRRREQNDTPRRNKRRFCCNSIIYSHFYSRTGSQCDADCVCLCGEGKTFQFSSKTIEGFAIGYSLPFHPVYTEMISVSAKVTADMPLSWIDSQSSKIIECRRREKMHTHTERERHIHRMPANAVYAERKRIYHSNQNVCHSTHIQSHQKLAAMLHCQCTICGTGTESLSGRKKRNESGLDCCKTGFVLIHFNFGDKSNLRSPNQWQSRPEFMGYEQNVAVNLISI